jgi:hypothetical protein
VQIPYGEESIFLTIKKNSNMKKVILSVCIGLTLISCTDNQLARNFGGSEEVKLKPNEVVLNVTWKGDELWICTRDTVTNVTYFKEKSSWGVVEGTVILK